MKQQPTAIVELSKNISVRTTMPESNYPALRSGFEGYPPNPRWTVSKYRAWKTGQQWRNALQRGEMVIQRDQLLVTAKKQPRMGRQTV
ncbi:MAG: hypothetical protein GVY04_02375 [Cyanobacteria bacterium]|jgi:hypothetical protein|nr:hypothetical protein [Cyanobacteria bacterium GSL.Bin1]